MLVVHSRFVHTLAQQCAQMSDMSTDIASGACDGSMPCFERCFKKQSYPSHRHPVSGRAMQNLLWTSIDIMFIEDAAKDDEKGVALTIIQWLALLVS